MPERKIAQESPEKSTAFMLSTLAQRVNEGKKLVAECLGDQNRECCELQER
jgi:hypothetical protein